MAIRSLFFLTPIELIWTTIGVLLTIMGTLLHLSVPESVPWIGGYSFSCQVGGVLLTGFLGGANAGLYAQIIYLGLGLAGLPVFVQGGGWDYIHLPTFGYLLGFLPAAWFCGSLSFPRIRHAPDPPRRRSRRSHSKRAPRPRSPQFAPVTLRHLNLAGLLGLGIIHLVGVIYIIFQQAWSSQLWQVIGLYSLYPLPGQIVVTGAVATVALVFRRLSFY